MLGWAVLWFIPFQCCSLRLRCFHSRLFVFVPDFSFSFSRDLCCQHYCLFFVVNNNNSKKKKKTWLTLRDHQAHHDHCPPSSLPLAVETGFHTYENLCGEGCYIGRQFVQGLPACPAPQCNSPSVATAAIQTLNTSCTSSCSSPACGSAYRTLRAAHDGCDDASIPDNVETAIHDFEDDCAAQECNMVTAAFNPNVCGSTPQPGGSAPILTPTTNAYGRLVATDGVDGQVRRALFMACSHSC
jgi:hypothetical protein